MTEQDKPLKAYRVYEKSEDSDYGMLIVFAENASKARQVGWERMDAISADRYIDLRARREPWADMYAGTEDIPLRAYLENGWWWMCVECEDYVSIEDLGGMIGDLPLCERCATERGLTPPDWALEGRRNVIDPTPKGGGFSRTFGEMTDQDINREIAEALITQGFNEDLAWQKECYECESGHHITPPLRPR